MKKIAALLILLFSLLQLQGQIQMFLDDNVDKQKSIDGIEVTDMIFNETITKIGNDFHHHFFQNWQNPSDITGISIYIKERPVPGMGSIIYVEIEDRMVYQASLRPQHQQIIDAAKDAIERAQSHLINYETIQQQLKSEDEAGSGIY